MSDDICELVLKFEAGAAAREVAEKRQALVRAERSLALRRRSRPTSAPDRSRKARLLAR